MKKLLNLLASLFVIALASCSPASNHPGDNTAAALSEHGQLVRRMSGYELRVLEDNVAYGGRAELSMNVTSLGGEQTVEVRARAQDLRSLYLLLEYDAARVHPVEAAPAAWPGISGDLLYLSVLDDVAPDRKTGRAWFGAVMPGLSRQSGSTGEFEVIRFRFADGPGQARKTSKAPSGPGSVVPDLAVDTVAGTASFSLYNAGDYNQDGRVAVTDLTPIGIHFGESVPLPPPAPENSIQAVVDGSDDGIVNVQDLTAIGLNFLARLDTYQLHMGSQSDYDAADNGASQQVAVIPFSPDGSDSAITRSGNPADIRLSYSVTSAALQNPAQELAWVQCFADDGAGGQEAGPKGQSLALGGGPDLDPPVWTDGDNPGLLGVLPRDGLVTVAWGEATDAVSAPVTYRVYYSEGPLLDFETAQTLDFDAATQYADIDGLTNGTQYSFAVRALDSAPSPNEEGNTTVLSGTPLATQDLPATVDADSSFDSPMAIPPGGTTEVGNCSVLTFNSDLTVEGTLSATDCDLHIIVFGKLTVNGELSMGASGPDPGGTGDDAYAIKVEAHGEVEFGPDSLVNTNGNFFLVDDPAELTSPQEAIDDTDTDQNPELYPFNFMPEPEEGPLSPKGGSSLSGYSFKLGQYQPARTVSNTQNGPFPCNWIVRGPWGVVPTPPPGVRRIVYKIRANMGQIQFIDWSITGPKGRKGSNENACTATGGKGEDAFRMRIHSPKKVTFNNVTINLGDGGDGGDATTPPCCDAMATGGEGGKPGKFRFTAGEEIAIIGTMTLNPGQGGTGGSATAIGQDGVDCPCSDGCNAVAIGGKGGSVKFGIAIRGNVNGVGGITLGPARGGSGGAATATGGKGGNGCPCGDGCSGGDATATGGEGGAAHFGSLAGTAGGGADGGPGGDATATAGAGGNGGPCTKFDQGGAGGPGGSATATGGTGVTGTGNGPLSTGLDGAGTATGGDGGNGGRGCLGGDGGAHGGASATGLPAVETDGADGLPGPTVCPRLWCIPIPGICPPDGGPGPEPVPDGFSGMAPLQDMETMDIIGSVPFVWDVSQAGCVSWFEGDLNTPAHILTFNSHPNLPCAVTFDFSNVTFDGTFPGIVGMELGTYQCRPLMPTTSQPMMGFLDIEMIPIEMVALDLVSVPPPFSEPPVLQDFHSGTIDSFFDVFATVTVPAQWEVLTTYIYIIDP
ncbi:hypothetical protein IT575_13155 [bacterium]|nr:hypothetical protein [bacterium]